VYDGCRVSVWVPQENVRHICISRSRKARHEIEPKVYTESHLGCYRFGQAFVLFKELHEKFSS
jgi:hypothetical protein